MPIPDESAAAAGLASGAIAAATQRDCTPAPAQREQRMSALEELTLTLQAQRSVQLARIKALNSLMRAHIAYVKLLQARISAGLPAAVATPRERAPAKALARSTL